MKGLCEEDFESLDELLSMDRDGGPLAAAYESDVAAAIDRHEAAAVAGGRRVRLAALLMEPLVGTLCPRLLDTRAPFGWPSGGAGDGAASGVSYHDRQLGTDSL